jgi:ketosteroid isomerase-like protein
MRQLCLIVTALLFSQLALGNAHEQTFPAENPADEKLNEEIQAFLNIYADVYNRQDYPTLLNMWDKDTASPIYMAEEIDPPLHGWNRLNAYFNPKPGFTVLDGIRNEYSEVRAHYLSNDLAVATYKLHYDIKVKRQKPMSSWDRVMAVFRKKEDGWKLVAYAEAPQSPLTMVRKMLQGQVPDDFDDYLKERKEEAAAK